jgi:hypothetical protein
MATKTRPTKVPEMAMVIRKDPFHSIWAVVMVVVVPAVVPTLVLTTVFGIFALVF